MPATGITLGRNGSRGKRHGGEVWDLRILGGSRARLDSTRVVPCQWLVSCQRDDYRRSAKSMAIPKAMRITTVRKKIFQKLFGYFPAMSPV